MVGNLIVNNTMNGIIIDYQFDEINTAILDLVAGEISLTGNISGILENETCSQEYKVFYDNGVRRRFIIKSYMKKKEW